MRKVEGGQGGAIREHPAHIFHLGGIEMGHIERGQR